MKQKLYLKIVPRMQKICNILNENFKVCNHKKFGSNLKICSGNEGKYGGKNLGNNAEKRDDRTL